MVSVIQQRMQQMGLALPEIGTAAGNYLPFVTVGKIVYLSGQVPRKDGVPHFIGKLGREFGVGEGRKAAELCALNLLALLNLACEGDLDRVQRCVKLVGFVNSMPDFMQQPEVVNGASELIIKVFGEMGRHARSAVGLAALPAGVAVEVEGIFELK